MEPFRTILFAADFSERSKEAFRVACSLGDHKPRLIVLHVAEGGAAESTVVAGELGLVLPLDGGHQQRLEALTKHLGEFYLPQRPVEVSYRTVDGVASDVILHEAETAGADLIVLATHGRKGLRRLLAGSVAESVLRKAVCPVLALRSPELPHPADEIRTILHPTDFSDDSLPALQVARSIARDRGSRLIVLHVAPNDSVVEGSIIPVDMQPFRNLLEDIRGRYDGPDLKYPMETHLAQGESDTEIIRVAAETDCDLIVMGTHGRTGLRRLLMGSVAEDVLRRANCPALFVKAPHREQARVTGQATKHPVTIF